MGISGKTGWLGTFRRGMEAARGEKGGRAGQSLAVMGSCCQAAGTY